MRISFKDDYSEGCHPNILNALIKTNNIQTAEGNYGEDRFCEEAKSLIHKALQNNSSAIHLVSGGTQANLLVISAFLKPHEAVISATSGHIAVHETGAIEATGHKVITVATTHGKLDIPSIQKVLEAHHFEHMVKPKMVYISNATELGTIYTKKELQQLKEYCTQHNLIFFLDGARLGCALTAKSNDILLHDLTQLTDVFYIGGTKNGALLGEAIVINNPKYQEDFRYHIKQKGALLAKSRILGIQFSELFQNNLFFDLAESSNIKANSLATAIQEKGYQLWLPQTTNQVFPILPDAIIQKIQKNFTFHVWEKTNDDKSVIRLVTSWATSDKNIENFISQI